MGFGPLIRFLLELGLHRQYFLTICSRMMLEKLYSPCLSEEEIQTLADIDNGGGGGEKKVAERTLYCRTRFIITMDEVKDGTGESRKGRR